MDTPTLWTAYVTFIDSVRGVIVDPRSELKIECFKQENILHIVLFHHFPACFIAPHAAGPEFMTRVPDLFPESKKLRNIVEFIGDKSELGFANFVKVHMFAWGGRSETVFQPLPVKDGHVELGAIVMYADIRSFTEIVYEP